MMPFLSIHHPAARLCAAAVSAALVFTATAFFQVPIPLGYAHLGDAVIFMTALLLPRRKRRWPPLSALPWRISSPDLPCGQGLQ